MKLKANVLGVLAALALALSFIGPARAADDFDDDDPVTVTLTDDGTFAVQLVGTNLTPVTVNALTGPTSATGTIQIQYVDTKSYRIGFDTSLQATNFLSTLAIPVLGGFYQIPASGLLVTFNQDPQQCRWSGQGLGRVGDIGSTTAGNDNNHSGSGNHSWAAVPTANRQLNVPQLIGWGFKGPGTATALAVPPSPPACSGNPIGTTQNVGLQLDIPANTPGLSAGLTYTSTVTVTVVPNASIP